MSVNAVQFGATGSDNDALFLKMYWGSMVEAPRSSIFLWDKGLPFIDRRTVDAGKSFQFLMDADAPAPEEFTPGDEVLGQLYAYGEGTVTADGYIVCHKYVPRDAMLKSHFNILPRLGRQHLARMQREYDKRVMIQAALGARAAAATEKGLTIHNGGNRLTKTGGTIDLGVLTSRYSLDTTGATNLRTDLRTLAQQLDEDNVSEDRYAIAPPHIRTVVSFDNTAEVFSEDYIDGQNNKMKRQVTLLEGFKFLGWPNTTSNNGPFPNQDFTASSMPSKYRGNFTIQASSGVPAILTFANGSDGSACLGVAEYESIQAGVFWRPEKLSYLVMSWMYVGCNYMHPWPLGSIEIIV